MKTLIASVAATATVLLGSLSAHAGQMNNVADVFLVAIQGKESPAKNRQTEKLRSGVFRSQLFLCHFK